MAKAVLPSQEVLRQLLDYNPETGSLVWRDRPLSLFPDARSGKIWNSRYARKEAFRTTDVSGYRRGAIFNVPVLAHRVIWKLMTGDDPDVIDHKDGNPSNNAWDNLRSVSLADNARNQKKHITNTSGTTGVWRAASTRRGSKRWEVRVGRTLIGYYTTFEEAVAARKAAEREHGFHPNHGRAA